MSVSSLPPSWRQITLGEVAAPVPNAIVDGPFGSNLKTCDYVDEGVPVLQGKNITNDSFRWFDVRFISNQKATELKRSSVRVGDILIIKIGSIGYSAIVENLNGFEFAIIPANLAKITPDASKVDLLYLHKWLTSVDAKRYLISVASKTAQPALSLGKIKSLPLPLPPLAEQKRIAAILDAADALRTKRREAIAQLDALLKSSFLTLFGDPVENPMRWEVRPLGSLAKFINGDRGVNYPSKTDFVHAGIPFINAGHLRGGKIDFSDMNFITRGKFNKLGSGKTQPGDLIYCLRGSLGKTAIVRHFEDSAIASSLVILRPTEMCQPEFLYEYLVGPSGQQQMRLYDNGSSQPNLSAASVKKYVVPLPPLPLQQKFAAIVESVERQKAAQRAHLAELDALFAALQHRAFRGEL